ncbi:uncharacterized protein V6R79_011881 [Siganus canaliculatus]
MWMRLSTRNNGARREGFLFVCPWPTVALIPEQLVSSGDCCRYAQTVCVSHKVSSSQPSGAFNTSEASDRQQLRPPAFISGKTTLL